MSVKRVEQIIAFADAMIRCYENELSDEERQALQAWEASDEFTRTDLWPGWIRHIGPSPCARPASLQLVGRRTA